jgi:hypothetical protein
MKTTYPSLGQARRLTILCFAMCGLTGCGGSGKTVVTGQLKMDGAPYALDEKEQLAVIFHPQEGKKDPLIARVETNGSYKVDGGDGKGIPPGKYRVEIQSVPRIPSAGGKTEDKFKGAFSAAASPHVVEVSASNHTIDLELNPAKVK